MKYRIDIINEIDTIPPFPKVLNRILEIANDADASLSDLADIVQYDLTLTANLLKLCNSAYFGFPVSVDSVNHAVKMLGMKKTIEMALIGSVSQNLLKVPKGYGLKRGELLISSVASALLAKSFAEKKHPNFDPFLLYTASLLKDIGKVVIEGYVGRSLDKINRLVNKKGYSFEEAETQVLGINHAELGGIITERWNFRAKLVFLIRNHHLENPNAREDFETAIIYLSDTIARMANVGIGADGLAYHVYDEIFGFLGVSQADIKDLMEEYQLKINIAKRLLGSM